MKLQICHLYPDVLNLYGDTGNILCLQKRMAWRGIESSVTALPIGAKADLTRFDLFFIGGGQDFEQEVLLTDLHTGKGKELRAAVEDGKTFLCICGGYQLMGEYYRPHQGEQYDGIGALGLYTLGSETRMTGDYLFRCEQESGGSLVAAFENHSGKTYLGEGLAPLGRVLAGYGNNGEDGTEGARYKNVFGTYAHGPLLPKNPEFADLILQTALSRKDPGFVLSPLDDMLEHSAHDFMVRRLEKNL